MSFVSVVSLLLGVGVLIFVAYMYRYSRDRFFAVSFVWILGFLLMALLLRGMHGKISFAGIVLDVQNVLVIYLVGGAGLMAYAGIRTRWPYPSYSNEQLLQRIMALAQEGNEEAAYRAAKQLAAKTTRQPTALFWLGALANRLGKYRTSVRHLRFAAELDPNSVEILLELGFSLQAMGKVQEATAVYQRVLALDPNDAEAAEGVEACQPK